MARPRINGIPVAQEPIETKRYVAYIPENLILYPDLTGLENLAYFSALAGKTTSKEEMMMLLIRSGLQEADITQRVASYSKGMRQKVGIAIALAKEGQSFVIGRANFRLGPQGQQ